MNETRPFVGIDLGSSAVSVVVAELEGERLASPPAPRATWATEAMFAPLG